MLMLMMMLMLMVLVLVMMMMMLMLMRKTAAQVRCYLVPYRPTTQITTLQHVSFSPCFQLIRTSSPTGQDDVFSLI